MLQFGTSARCERRGGAPSHLSHIALACLALSGCGGDDSSVAAAAPSTGASAPPTVVLGKASCEALSSVAASTLPNPSTVISTAAYVVAAAASGSTPAVPDHCLIQGTINKRTGTDGQPYQISFELRMPTTWNSRFFMLGGGGTNGTLLAAYGSPGLNYSDTALQRGFAVVSTDGGHDVRVDNNPNALGAVSFGMDPQARLDHGYVSYDQTTQVGKALVTKYYGTPANKSYFVGCSEGGREAMMFTQRFPNYYDGVVAGDPGFQIPKVGIDGAWTSKAFAAIATTTDANGAALINKTFSDPDLLLVRNAVLAKCDALDGVADGLVANTAACQIVFDPQTAVLPSGKPLQCTGAKQADCLTSDQLVALKTALSAPVDSKGQPLYSDWPWDAGFGGIANGTYNQGWRSWWLGTYSSSANTAQRLNGASEQSWLIDWASPPIQVPLTGVAARILAFDFDVDAPKIFATSGAYTTSAAAFDIYNSTDLSAFKAHGGKLILFHGLSDAAFSANDTARWYQALNAKAGNSADAFARLYLVPGMNHCGGGPSTDSFDMLTPLVSWVEQGAPPESVTATATTPAFFNATSRTRPLCVYPKFSAYVGSGDINDGANFICR
jgi:poly(3-hydroxybutyrate) depolymerase